MRAIPFALFAVILSASAASSAAPQIIVNDLDPTRHPYMQFATSSCGSLGDCILLFPATIGAKTLVVHASCNFSMASGNFISNAALGSQNANPRNALPVFAYGTNGGFTSYGINADTYVFYTTGQQPRIDVVGIGAAVSNLSCTISGYYR